ncbi:hypothetical protein BV898_17892 [Hypsibius exemplaris]|uniref:Uncharacterized protein n=1 Tax=Hypsibius exemplaris TaxID=2072580 RepID=A0A9X6RMM0_HYPEX|nr:hypothetical protein BV898_17892 [Hypsibius exemplaris]
MSAAKTASLKVLAGGLAAGGIATGAVVADAVLDAREDVPATTAVSTTHSTKTTQGLPGPVAVETAMNGIVKAVATAQNVQSFKMAEREVNMVSEGSGVSVQVLVGGVAGGIAAFLGSAAALLFFWKIIRRQCSGQMLNKVNGLHQGMCSTIRMYHFNFKGVPILMVLNTCVYVT